MSPRDYASRAMPSQDERVDALFELPPEEFTAARDRLAKEISDASAAAEVKSLRRPTVPAWAVNQTVRRHPDELQRLLDAGREVRAAQRRAASGLTAPTFAQVTAERRRLVSRLTDLAAEVLAGAGRSAASHLGPIGATFEAAASDEAAAEAVQAARLSKELVPTAGFEILGGFQVVEGEAEATTDRPDPAVTRAEREVEKWRTRLATVREELRAAEREAKTADGRVADLERDLDRARRASADAGARSRRLATKLEEAERRLEEAVGRLGELGRP